MKLKLIIKDLVGSIGKVIAVICNSAYAVPVLTGFLNIRLGIDALEKIYGMPIPVFEPRSVGRPAC
jgi:hypothetical protein